MVVRRRVVSSAAAGVRADGDLVGGGASTRRTSKRLRVPASNALPTSSWWPLDQRDSWLDDDAGERESLARTHS